MSHELEQLVAALDEQRDGVLKKLAGLSAAEARRSTVPSGTNLAGLLQHLTFVEAKWFEAILAVIAETARHAGHADILREQIDGKTGR